MKVKLDSLPKIKEFVSIVNDSECVVDLIAGKSTYLDARSILGILSCNYREPMEIKIREDSEKKYELMQQIDKFVVC